MAKAAKTVEIEVSEQMADKFVSDILERFENIESARGVYMNQARREREAMQGIYEGMAARGISQKAAKTEIKIITAMQKVKGWIADLEAEDRKMVQKLAKAQNDKTQLQLFGDLPPLSKPAKAPKTPKAPKPEKSNVLQLHEEAESGAA